MVKHLLKKTTTTSTAVRGPTGQSQDHSLHKMHTSVHIRSVFMRIMLRYRLLNIQAASHLNSNLNSH